MRIPCSTLAAIAVFATTAIAQSPLVTLAGGTNGGNVDGAIYFELQVNTTVTLTSLAFRTGALTPAGNSASVDLLFCYGDYTYQMNNPAVWQQLGSTVPATVVAGAQVVTAALVPTASFPSVTFGPGSYGIALVAHNCSHGYTNGNGSVLLGSGTNQTFATAEMTLRAGHAQSVPFGGNVTAPRVWNGQIAYTLGGTSVTTGTRLTYGTGCYGRYRSFYEFFPTSIATDLDFRSLRLTFDAPNNRYSAITLGTTPVNTAAVTSTSLGHGDNSNITVALAGGQPILFPDLNGAGSASTTVEMCSNLYVNLRGTTPAIGNPTVAAWLGGSAARIGNHHDVDPSAAGSTHYDYDAVNSVHLFTWLGVPDRALAGTSNTFQLAFFANGDAEMRWGNMSQAGGGSWPTLVGFTPGGSSIDPGNRDLSAITSLSTSGTELAPLQLTASANPVLGTTIQLNTQNPTSTGLGICFLSLASTGVPNGIDLVILGAPGCFVYLDISQGFGTVIGNSVTFLMSVPLTLPAGAVGLIGAQIYGQSVWVDSSQNPFGAVTSNGVMLVIG